MSLNSLSIVARCVLILLCILLASASAAEPAAGTEIGKIMRVARKFILDPARPRIYASTTLNTVIAIDTRTRSISGEIPIGSNPEGLDISADGTRLYVANGGSTVEGIGVVDLTTFTKLPALSTLQFTSTVAAGVDGRLYIADERNRRLLQVSTADGSIQEVFGNEVSVYSSILALTPDRKTLIHGNRGLSPASLARYDVTSATPVFKEAASDLGGNGQSVTINRAGTKLAYSTGSGQGGYGIALIPTTDVRQTFGIMQCGAYPGPGAFSPDGTRFFTTPFTQNVVKIFDTSTYVQTGSFGIGPQYSSWVDVQDLVTNHRGNVLYVATDAEIIVYATGLPSALQITSASAATAHQDETFSFQLTANQPDAVFSATGLPPGLTMNSAGLIVGTPTVAGDFTVRVTTSDSLDTGATQDLVLTVLTPFTVAINGEGTVTSGYLGTTWRKIGSPFSITAMPAADFAFGNWSGSITASNPTISGIVQEKRVLTATFLPTTEVTIAVSGPGQVTPGLAGATRHIIGANLTITAFPDSNARFITWKGASNSTNRTITVTVEPGTSLVANFEAIPPATITIHASGPGSVTPALAGTSVHLVGTMLTVQATPDAGARFLGWNGSVTSMLPQITFAVAPELALVAHFESMAFYAGSYLIMNAAEGPPGSKVSIKLQLGVAGSFTGVLSIDGVPRSFTGDFLSAEGFHATISRGKNLPPVQLHLVLSKIGEVPALSGTIDTGSGAVPLTGLRLGKYSAASPPAAAGRYTWGAAPSESPDAPHGASFGTANVDVAGALRISGTLGDGTPFSASASLGENEHALLNVRLYAGKGTLTGMIQFRDLPGASDFDGTPVWVRSSTEKGLFPAGFRLEMNMIGSRIATLAAEENIFSGSRATFRANDFPVEVAILPNNKMVAPSPDSLKLQLQLIPATHSFTGSFLLPGTTIRKAFRGRILAKPERAFGQFRDGNGIGSVILTAP